jgi:myosin protein heavy chain
MKEKADQLNTEARHTKEQLSELTRTAAEYCNMITRKEEQIDALTTQSDTLKTEYDKACVEIMALRADIDTLDGQLAAVREDHTADLAARDKLIEERDDLRVLLATKASEETRRSEVEKSRELELAELRGEVTRLHQDLGELKRLALETQHKARLELEQITRDHTSLQSSHDSLLNKEGSIRSQLTIVQTQLSELDKAKRTLESELLSSRSRLHEHEGQLAEALRAKDVGL